MSELPAVLKSVMNCADAESRPVLGPAGNKTRSAAELRKPASKPKSKVENAQEVRKSPLSFGVTTGSPPHSKLTSPPPPSILSHKDSKFLKSNLSLNASCSSDASSDSSHSRASTGKIGRRSVTPTPTRRKQSAVSKTGNLESVPRTISRAGKLENVVIETDGSSEASADASPVRKRCAWVTPNTDPCYAVFHDEEWGVPAHDDKKLFELLSLSTALAELTWLAILNKRHLFREVFHEFDPVAVSKLNDKKIVAPGNPALSLLSEVKLRGIIENALQVCKIVDEFGSFNKYVWGFVNNKPTVNQFRYPRQVPIKTSKADLISKDLVKRGFRGVGPTVVYAFMQVAGITNDHLVSCFRFRECLLAAGDAKNPIEEHQNSHKPKGRISDDSNGLGLTRVVDELSLSTEKTSRTPRNG